VIEADSHPLSECLAFFRRASALIEQAPSAARLERSLWALIDVRLFVLEHPDADRGTRKNIAILSAYDDLDRLIERRLHELGRSKRRA
jgi:hypothetical protein